MVDTLVPTTICEGCGAPNNGAAGPDQAVPKKGDYSVCAYCGQWGIYRADQTVRLMTTRDIDAIDDETRVILTMFQRAADKLRTMR